MTKTIWFDSATPKYGLFYSHLIPAFKKLGYKILVTTRGGDDYQEAQAVLDLAGIDYHKIGNHGGLSVVDKFRSRLDRQKGFLDLFNQVGVPDALITGCVPDSTQTAFGLGMPSFLLCDTPIGGDHFDFDLITLVTRLSVPLATKVFYPNVIPAEVFSHLAVSDQNAIPYSFIDVHLWMNSLEKNPAKDFRKKYGLDESRPTILLREEEYKAHYVKTKTPLFYELLETLVEKDLANLVLLPRYEVAPLKEKYGDRLTVLEGKLAIDEFYPFIDLLIGGGGTMNLEAACYGIPVVSTRSLHLFHDRYLIENGLMAWVESVPQGIEAVKKGLMKKRQDQTSFFWQDGASLNQIVQPIHEKLSCAAS